MIRLHALVLGVFLFISLIIGAGIAWLVAKIFHHSIERLALLCGGFLVGLLALDIIPSALNSYKSPGIVLGILIGFMFLLLANKLIHSSHQYKPSVYLLTIALFIHTIPLSLTIGNLLGYSTFALSITTSTILHHIPEGFALTSIFLSQGQKLIGLLLCFISLSIWFSMFIWIGNHLHLGMKEQSVLLGVSIGLIAVTSIKEFILHNIHVMSIRSASTFIVMGYLLSAVFHVVF
ncbi:zinc transporter family protein [Psychrobacillus sp. OK032]|uniref:zinc transporter family protein n=1 Tax=Psychrobacillus sp. OK032 TaxID=1884358 RepID=UPI0008AC25CE|nr:zinc transporter family protein [Psychrobacillus sp. OK032]SER78895.1 zinc transporter, ZIP family [Psychrobacillus sp. OK032]